MLGWTSSDVLRSEYADLDGAQDEALVLRTLAAAERFVERYTHRQFRPEPVDAGSPVVKHLSTRNRGSVRIPDLRRIDTVALRGVGVSTGYFDLNYGPFGEPATQFTLSPAWSGSVYEFSTIGQLAGLNDLVIGGWWGWDPVPEDVVDATYVAAVRFYRERDASYSDAVATPDGGMLQFYRALPPRVQATLENLRVREVRLVCM